MFLGMLARQWWPAVLGCACKPSPLIPAALHHRPEALEERHVAEGAPGGARRSLEVGVSLSLSASAHRVCRTYVHMIMGIIGFDESGLRDLPFFSVCTCTGTCAREVVCAPPPPPAPDILSSADKNTPRVRP